MSESNVRYTDQEALEFHSRGRAGKIEIVTPPNLDSYFNPQAYIFLSRHRAESGIASLTVHTTGNFKDEAILGCAGPCGGATRAILCCFPKCLC